MRCPGQVLSRSYLIDRVFSGDYDGTSNVIDSYVSHIRNKIDKPFGRRTIRPCVRSGTAWIRRPEARS